MSDADRIIKKIRGGISTARPFWQGVAKVLGFPIQQVDPTTTSYDVPDDGNLLVTVETALGNGPYTVTLPVAPEAGQRVIVKDSGGNAEMETIEVDPNGFPVEGVVANLIIAIDWDFRYLLFDGTQWLVIVTGVGGVTSVFGRTGDVVAVAGDYDAVQIDYDNATSGLAATNVQDAIDELEDAADNDIIAGGGLTGGGSLQGGDVTIDVIANADGSIVVNPDDIQVGEINDAQHGDRGRGTLHDVATPAEAGFMSAADKTKLDGIEDDADVDDKDVMVSGNDTTPGFLIDKIVAGSNITVTEINNGGNETVRITGTSSDTFEVKVSVDDTTEDFLEAKIIGGDGVTVTTLSPGGNEDLEISSDLQQVTTAQGGTAVTHAHNVTFSPSSNGDYFRLFNLSGGLLAEFGLHIGTGDAEITMVADDIDIDGVNALSLFGDVFDVADGNKSGSTFAGNLVLSAASSEWDDYETEFGEVSLLEAIYEAAQRPSPASSPQAANYWGEFSTTSTTYVTWATFAWPSEFSGFSRFYCYASGLDSGSVRVRHNGSTTVAEITAITSANFYEDTSITAPGTDGYAILEGVAVTDNCDLWGWGFD